MASLRELVVVRSQQADLLLEYLASVEGELGISPLLERFGYSLDDLRAPLRVSPFRPQIRAEGDRDENRPSRRAYASRGAMDPEETSSGPPRPVADVELGQGAAVVLGDPGSGKTEWLKQLARRRATAQREQIEDRTIQPDQALLPVFVRLPEVSEALRDTAALHEVAWIGRSADGPARLLTDAQQFAAAIIVAMVKHHQLPLRLAGWVWGMICPSAGGAGTTSSAPLVLLDALDEVRTARAALRKGLSAFVRETRCRVLVTSRIVGYKTGLLGNAASSVSGAGSSEWQIHPFQWDETRTFITQFFRSAPASGSALMADLQHKDAVAGMAQNPLLTTMLCVAFLPDSGQQRPDNPACRVDVYQRILERLLSGWKPDEETDPPPEGVIPAKIAILREMAFRFFPGVELDADELREFLWGEDGHFVALPEDDRLRQWLRAQGIPLEEELCRDGVLKCGRTGKYIFILPTFQEYLAALAFCRMIEDSKTRWDREVEIAGRRGSARDFLDHKAWDPRWQAVISMLTGLLHDPAPLLELLAEETEDDQFRYRLALAAWCVVDISLARRPQQRSLIDQITTEVFSVWWEHHRNTTTAVVPHLTRALPAIAAAGGIVSAPAGSGVPVIARLLELSRNVDPDVRRSAADAMGALGPGGARDDVIKRLLDLSRDKDYGVLRSAVRALGALGPMAARDDVINRLLELSMDEDCGVLRSAVRALGALGPAAARDDEITRLVDPSAGRELRSATAC